MAMKNHARLYQACLLLVVLATISAPALANELRARVVSVAEGDTITVLDEAKRHYKIRLNGIDAPESSQDFGQVAKRNLSDLVFGSATAVGVPARLRLSLLT
jgi:endonuclease YncB( thermonuclease family)